MAADESDGIRAAIEQLYQLYTTIQATPERSGGRIAQRLIAKKLHDELIRLGFTEDQFERTSISVRDAVEAVANLRRTEFSGVTPVDRPARARAIDLKARQTEARSMIREITKAMGVKLSAGGRQMLTIPLLESYQINHEWDRNEIRSSIDRIVKTLEVDESELPPKISSVDVIRSFSKNFCNIPPFCRRRAERG